jgi:tRNA dimethylallyltransferase
MSANSNPTAPARLVVVLGPTASGKSALGIELAKRLDGEILVCDSTQLYRHFDIGTAKVSASDHSVKTGQENIPHHLVDLVEPNEVFTAGDYRRHALLALDDLRARGKTPIITAGTGLYLRALLEGLADAPQRSEELRARLREIVDARGAAHLHKILARLDPGSAARIAPRDTQKIIRAIEMRVLTGKPLAEIFSSSRAEVPGELHSEARGEVPEEARSEARVDVHGEQPVNDRAEVRDRVPVNDRAEVHEKVRVGVTDKVREGVHAGVREGVRENQLQGYAITKIGLLPPRPALYARIDARVNEMLAAGWLDEVRALIARGFAGGSPAGMLETVKPFQFIGYADLRAHLEGRITLAAAIAQIQQSTRRFAKRQLTWFRREPDVHWLESFGDAPETTTAALNLLAANVAPKM